MIEASHDELNKPWIPWSCLPLLGCRHKVSCLLCFILYQEAS